MLLEAGSADIREMLNTSDISEDSKSASRGWRKDFQILSSQTRTSTILTILLYIYLPSYPLQDFSSRQHTAILQTSVQSVTHVQAPIPPGSALATDWRPQQNPPVWSFFPSRTNRSPSFLGNRETRRTCTWPTRSLHVPRSEGSVAGWSAIRPPFHRSASVGLEPDVLAPGTPMFHRSASVRRRRWGDALSTGPTRALRSDRSIRGPDPIRQVPEGAFEFTGPGRGRSLVARSLGTVARRGREATSRPIPKMGEYEWYLFLAGEPPVSAGLRA